MNTNQALTAPSAIRAICLIPFPAPAPDPESEPFDVPVRVESPEEFAEIGFIGLPAEYPEAA